MNAALCPTSPPLLTAVLAGVLLGRLLAVIWGSV